MSRYKTLNRQESEDAKTQLVQKNKIHSVLTALPFLMVMIGVGYYYYGERKQAKGALVLSEAEQHIAVVDGLSVIKSVTGKSGKHFFWFEIDGRKRGARVSESASVALEGLVKGDEIEVYLAPRVAGSKTLWTYQVIHRGASLLNEAPGD